MRLGEMWKHAEKCKVVEVEVIHTVKKVVTRTNITPNSCEECDGTPSDRCAEEYNCLVAFERGFNKPFVGAGK